MFFTFYKEEQLCDFTDTGWQSCPEIRYSLIGKICSLRSKFISLREDPIENGAKNEIGRVTFLKVYPFAINLVIIFICHDESNVRILHRCGKINRNLHKRASNRD